MTGQSFSQFTSKPSLSPIYWPRAEIKLVIIPPESDSLVTQLDFCRAQKWQRDEVATYVPHIAPCRWTLSCITGSVGSCYALIDTGNLLPRGLQVPSVNDWPVIYQYQLVMFLCFPGPSSPHASRVSRPIHTVRHHDWILNVCDGLCGPLGHMFTWVCWNVLRGILPQNGQKRQKTKSIQNRQKLLP